MPPKNSGGSTKFPGGHKVIHRTAQTAFVRVVTPREHCMLRNKQILLLGDAYMKKKLINRLSFTYSMFIDDLQ